jgi:hypothetical protein
LTSEKRFLYFSISFISLTLAFVSKVLGNFAIYIPKVKFTVMGDIVRNTFHTLVVDKINALGFLFYIIFMTFGFMMLFLIVSRLQWKDKRVIAMLMYMAFIASWLGVVHYQLFFLTTFVMICLITYSYYKNYLEMKSKNTLTVAIAFGILVISHALFMFSIYAPRIYVLAQIIQMVGFLCLLIPFVLIFIKKPNNKNKLVK